MTNDTPNATETPTPGPAEAVRKLPYEAAKKVVMSTNLERVRFCAFSAQSYPATATVPDEVSYNAATNFLRPVVTRDGSSFSTRTTLVFQLTGTQNNADATETYGVIRATLEAEYNLKADSAEFSDEELQQFALCYCPFHVWGYWREFVQSSLSRLDLPPFTVPLFRINMALKLVQDQLD